jgi:hypothetical protein
VRNDGNVQIACKACRRQPLNSQRTCFDDVDQEFGVVVTKARSVFTFTLHYGPKGDLGTQIEDAVIDDWKDITGSWAASPYADNVRETMQILGND